LGHGEKHCQSIGPCHWPNNCSDGEPVAVQELCCVVCPEEIRRNGWTPCNCPGTCAEGQKPILVPGECCPVCEDRDPCKVGK
jgi:hypothetical protein